MKHVKMLSLLMVVSSIVVAHDEHHHHHHSYKSHKVQVVINPFNESWNPQYSVWAINTPSSGISYDFEVNRSVGAYYVMTGLMFPKGTVNKYQADYGVDKHGNALQVQDSLGSFVATDFVLSAFNPSSSLPAAGTFLTTGTWAYFFNSEEGQDNLYSIGRQKAGELGESNGNPIEYARCNVDGGTGKYAHHDERPNIVSAKVYLSASGVMLIKVKFDKEIEVCHSAHVD